jgi:hypothetical protein
MCRIDDADNDYVLVVDRRPVAAWPHQCSDCGRRIEVGERYRLLEWVEVDWSAYYDRQGYYEDDGRELPALAGGHRDSSIQCAHCEAAGGWLVAVCNGFLYGAVCSELSEHWDESPMYHTAALGRLVIASGCRPELGTGKPWTRRDGSLIAVATVESWVDQALGAHDRRGLEHSGTAA